MMKQKQFPEEEHRGIVLELSPDVAEDLRRQQQQRQERRRKKADNNNKTADNNKTTRTNLEEDDWNDILPLQRQPDEEATQEQNSEHDTNDAGGNESSTGGVVDGDCLSFAPPTTMPRIMVNLEKLVGYTPTSPQEAAILYKQVKAAIWGTAYHHDDDDDGDDQGHERKETEQEDEEDIQQACMLDERVSKLFETGVARHIDTGTSDPTASASASVNPLNFCLVDYPEYLYQISLGVGDESISRVVKTARLWKQLFQRINIPVVDRVLDHLQNCSQSLFWKQAMHAEIKHLALVQREEFTRHQQARALRLWHSAGRKAKLEELYAVRETFVHRLELTKERLQRLQDQREAVVKGALEQRRLQQQDGGLEAFDFNSNVFAFDDSTNFGSLFDDGYDLLGNRIEEDMHDLDGGYNLVSDEEEEELDDESSSYRENDSDRTDDRLDIEEAAENKNTQENDDVLCATTDSAMQAPSCETKSMPSSGRPIDRPKRHAHAARTQRLRLEQASKDAEYNAKLEAAKALEEQLRDEHTSHELKTAMVAVDALGERVERVDELLESLQEEEWANEEKDDSGQGIDGLTLEDDGAPDEKFSLLDQVLAMILGSSPPALSQDMESHLRYIQKEHLDIVRQWKTEFGRLPSAFVREKPRSTVDSGMNKVGEIETVRSPTWKDDETRGALTDKDATLHDAKDVKSLKQALGIQDNNDSDWDDASM